MHTAVLYDPMCYVNVCIYKWLLYFTLLDLYDYEKMIRLILYLTDTTK